MPQIPATFAESVMDQITEDIVHGRLMPGSKLRIDELRKRYGMGASPLREALARLHAQGFVTNESRRGFRVAAVSKQDIREITEVRSLIELKALEISMVLGGKDWEEQIVMQMARLRHVVRLADDGLVTLDPEVDVVHEDYHRSLIAGCQSPRLIGLQETYYDLAKRYRILAFKHTPSKHDFIERHEILTDIVLSRRLEAALAELRRHLDLIAVNLPEDLPE
jgi:DNA-binding GntR family transcriptional regulator